ncbi:MAG: dihydropteroate synthase [Desulfovibrionaceae bacterium]|nr:dihydropteroate synthase [Desulfovibrionaceae bacterium]
MTTTLPWKTNRISAKVPVKPVWRVRGGRQLPAPLVFAIVNITPDSFYDGGSYPDFEQALERCRHLIRAGVPVLDIGAESTRPGAVPLSPQEEWARLEPVLPRIAALKKEQGNTSFWLSVDTYHAETARKALIAGAHIINDISAFSFDPHLKEVLLEYRPGYVLMHNPLSTGDTANIPAYKDVVGEVEDFLEGKMNELVKGGFPEEQIILDPGIGFGKALNHNLELLRGLERLEKLGRPVLIGLSNKRMFGDLLGLKTCERAMATQVATALLAQRGVYAHRVHAAVETLQTLKLVEALQPQADTGGVHSSYKHSPVE